MFPSNDPAHSNGSWRGLFFGPWNASIFQLQQRHLLVQVDLQEIRNILDEAYGNHFAFQTRRNMLPGMTAEEERAIFTFSTLMTTNRLCTTIQEIISEIADQIEITWGTLIDVEEIRLSVMTSGRSMTVENHRTIRNVVSEHRPNWFMQQDYDDPNAVATPFRDFPEPYVFLLRCQRVLPAGYSNG